MPIRKAGERVKGTTRVSFGDRKLMTRLWIADKTSRFEKRRETRQLNKKEKEAFEQCPSHRGKKGFQAFLKDMRGLPKLFELTEDEEDTVAIYTMSRMGWFQLLRRHQALLHEDKVLDTFVREYLRGTKGREKLLSPDPLVKRLFAEFGGGRDDTIGRHHRTDGEGGGAGGGAETGTGTGAGAGEPDAFPTNVTASSKLVDGQIPHALNAEAIPLLYGRRNMRLMHQYRRLAKRVEQAAETVTTTSSHAYTHHMFHGGAQATNVEAERFAFANTNTNTNTNPDTRPLNKEAATTTSTAKKKRKRPSTTSDEEEEKEEAKSTGSAGTRRRIVSEVIAGSSEYAFTVGGLHATDGAWALVDGNVAPPRLSLQPLQWHVTGDSVVDSLMQKMLGGEGGPSPSSPPPRVPSASASASAIAAPTVSGERDTEKEGTNLRRHSSRRHRSRRSTTYSSSGDVGGFGFADEEQHRQHLRTEQRRNGVVFRHAYEVERQANLWTTCQRCRDPVHTCDMVVRESVGIDDVACFHPACLDAVNTTRKQETEEADAREKEVAQFSPLNVVNKKATRKAVFEAMNASIVEKERKRAAFLSARTLHARERTSPDNDDSDNDGGTDHGARRMDTVLDEMNAFVECR